MSIARIGLLNDNRRPTDSDSNGDTDQPDFTIVQPCISGRNCPGDPNCAG